MSAAVLPITFKRPCLWCILHRPGCAPNMVETQTPNSDGICAECVVISRAERKAARAAAAAVQP